MSQRKPRVGVIGAGPGGIAMGIQLTQHGYDFTVFERGDGFGGTWRNNTYPGAACDVPSHFYSFSFALNPYWSKTYANQPEILAYLEQVARDHRLGQHLKANTTVTSVRWSDADARWTIETAQGSRHQVDVVVSAVGMLDVPNVPAIPGREVFGGRVFHSSQWDHSKSTAGERVASVGTGASAIQYVPAIAADTKHLTIFQRTPIWVAPRFDDPFTAEQQELFASDPAEALKLRDAAFQQYEAADFDAESDMTKMLTDMSYNYLMKKVRNPQLRSKLLPDYPVGCKRPLQSKTWFPVFDLPNVTLETAPIVAFTEHGLRTADDVEHRVDTVIFGTGFKAADYLSSLDVYGRGCRRLRDDWCDGAEAYLGTAVPGYPNLFTLYGPNTNGITSMIYILEAQAEFVRRLLDTMTRKAIQAVEIKRDPHEEFNTEIQAALDTTVWAANCSNYFRHPSGKMVTQYPYSGSMFAQRLAAVSLDVFDIRPQLRDLDAKAGSV
ncbi:flavin-containing monooxygenase [Mycobacterium sp.]|uniref:flavin-containing monooxygenase n=1 Tax=Mycobacterium sp. TaxID=1785 RepID=UPI003BB1EF34